ncbi:guanine deaminase [Leptolyngbya ohadii]|uniref:guanine deaminase n=1 Tax=Leptolyngbya ohadii TaxID=1962290 RepID=UPI0019D42140|nr:guanine deaminase [Leptolyngbya ohadii]
MQSNPMQAQDITAVRGAFLDFTGDPFRCNERDSVRYVKDGLLVLKGGKVEAFGDYGTIAPQYQGISITEYPEKLIIPGFLDIHVHYPQTEIIAAYGEQLLTWLERYTFPTEAKFHDEDYARQIATIFLDELLRNGTTTALVLTTIFPQSVEVLFEEADRRNMRMIAGQVWMDRNAPDFLTNTAINSYQQSREQIERWHNRGRQLYAITPRFAITSTDHELQLAGKLKAEFPDVYVHTHLSENAQEIAYTAELFPDTQDYLEVYEKYGLVGDRSIFAHGLHLSESEFQRLSQAGATIAFCPTSNLFLGSGLFKLHRAKSIDSPVKVGLASDVGGGTSFSMLHTMSDAYKITQLQRQNLSSFKAFYLATLGAADSLSLSDKLGNFDLGKEADFTVLDLHATPLMTLRNGTVPAASLDVLEAQLFGTMILGDDRTIAATYVAGKPLYQNPSLLGEV